MSYIYVKNVRESDVGSTTIEIADASYGTDSEALQMAAELLSKVDMLDEGEVLVIWKVIL